mmetsp:Transcript_19614/g.48899  ORF Transcript_19614/g.48899 Transcript_19614/m.48899 type:complete len:118 (-) Transcript_19614:692-1045(-)
MRCRHICVYLKGQWFNDLLGRILKSSLGVRAIKKSKGLSKTMKLSLLTILGTLGVMSSSESPAGILSLAPVAEGNKHWSPPRKLRLEGFSVGFRCTINASQLFQIVFLQRDTRRFVC